MKNWLAVASFLVVSCANNENGLLDHQQEFRSSYVPVTLEYWITTEVIEDWDMVPSGRAGMTNTPIDESRQYLHKVIRYVATDRDWNKLPEPAWQRLSGPIIRATVGDSVLVHFKNAENAGMPLSIHPHNVRYDEKNEGIWRADRPDLWPDLGTAGGAVLPGDTFTYRWLADEKSLGAGPYHSHSFRPSDELDLGLIGAILVEPPPDHPDYVPFDTTVLFIFKTYLARDSGGIDSSSTIQCADGLIPWNGGCHPRDHVPEDQWPENLSDTASHGGGPEVHTINGTAFANLEGLSFRSGQKVRFVVIAMNTEGSQNHTIHFHGAMLQDVEDPGYYKDVFDLPSAMARQLYLDADNIGAWMIHCHIEHHQSEMMAMYTITDAAGVIPDSIKNNVGAGH